MTKVATALGQKAGEATTEEDSKKIVAANEKVNQGGEALGKGDTDKALRDLRPSRQGKRDRVVRAPAAAHRRRLPLCRHPPRRRRIHEFADIALGAAERNSVDGPPARDHDELNW